ncbi:MAG: hypothetical protein WCW33_01295 [Candidatus Babeliales bacterium]|jgi:hypothetical protein
MPRFETIILSVGLAGTSFLVPSSIIFAADNNSPCCCLSPDDIHRSTSELKTHIRVLHPHISFIAALNGPATVDGAISWFDNRINTMSKEVETIKNTADTQKLHTLVDQVSWLIATKNTLIEHKAQLNAAVTSTLTQFPFAQVSKKIHSVALQRALTQLGSHRRSDLLLQCWEVLVNFVEKGAQDERFIALFADDIARQKGGTIQERSQRCAVGALKDISIFVYIFYIFLAQKCAHSFFNEQEFAALSAQLLPITDHHKSLFNILSDIIQIIAIIEKLPIEQTLDAMKRFVKTFIALINKIEQTSEGGFVTWLRSRWLLVPLSVSIIAIKAIHHFVTKDSVVGAGSVYSGGYLF